MSEQVLIVEDDADLADAVAQTLELCGYEVALARNGLEALAAVSARMPALILLDMLMPVMDGWRFAQEFGARHGRSAPIVVMTAAEHARKRAAEIGVREVLAKPFDLNTLRETVQRVARSEPASARA
jgi:CheY-like chemotaxis protein